MSTNTINHVSINAKDLDESVQFYIDLLGPSNCERIPTPNFGVPVPVQWLRVGDRELHLFVFEHVPIASRYYHFSFSATDLDQFHRIYSSARDGGFLDSETYGHHVYEMPGGCAQLYVIDPAGNLVEIDWPDAGELDQTIVTDLKRIADRAPQSEENLQSSLYLDRLAAKGWQSSGAVTS